MRLILIMLIVVFMCCAANEENAKPTIPEETWDVIIYANLTTIKAEKYSNFPPPSYTLIFNVINGSIKVYKKYNNGTVDELSFPSDAFENFGKDNPYRVQREKLYAFNSTPDVVAWNGRYYLLDNVYSLIKYGGKKFTVYRIVEGYYVACYPQELIYLGDDCWIRTFIDPGTPPAGVMIYDLKKRRIVKDFEFDRNSSTVVKIKKLNDCNVNISVIGELFRW